MFRDKKVIIFDMEVYRTSNKKIIDKANIDDFFTAVYTREAISTLKSIL